jgi:hypothetical protein
MKQYFFWQNIDVDHEFRFPIHTKKKKYCFITILLHLFIAILLSKIARVTKALKS